MTPPIPSATARRRRDPVPPGRAVPPCALQGRSGLAASALALTIAWALVFPPSVGHPALWVGAAGLVLVLVLAAHGRP